MSYIQKTFVSGSLYSKSEDRVASYRNILYLIIVFSNHNT